MAGGTKVRPDKQDLIVGMVRGEGLDPVDCALGISFRRSDHRSTLKVDDFGLASGLVA